MTIFLSTKRMILRNFIPADGDAVFAYRNDEKCAKYQRWNDTSMEAVEKLIENHKDDVFLTDKKEQHYAIYCNHGTLIGEFTCFFTEKDSCITVGITIAPAYQGNGYAFEMLQEILIRLREAYPAMDVVALIDPQNQGSIRLFQKLGFEEECYAEKIHSLVYTKYAEK